MKNQNTSRMSIANKPILVGIGLGALYWILESAIHAFIFHRGNLVGQILTSDPNELWMRSVAVCIIIAFGGYAQFVTTKLRQEITERERAEEATKLVYAELDQIFNTAADGMRVIDKEFNVLRVNETFSTLSGVSKDEAVGKKCYEVFPAPQCHTPDCPLTRILGGEERVECEVEKERKDGIRVPCILTATPFRGLGGELIGIVEDIKDITERKRAEEALRRAHDELERRVEERTAELTAAYQELKETQAQLVQVGKMAAIGQLAGGVAHELNNPLTGVLIYAKRLLKKADDQALRDNEAFRVFPESLRLIDEAAIRCKTITDSLLTFSRQAKFEFAPLDVNQVIENTLTLIRSQLKFHRITLIQELQPDLPPVVGNANQLQQVFTNIIINARQAMPDGGQLVIKSEVQSRESRDADLGLRTMDYVTVSFTDTGSGIPEENLDKIWEPFFTTQPVGQGTGLGLSISYGIVEAHKGFIEVESQVGVGSTFTVFLPVGE